MSKSYLRPGAKVVFEREPYVIERQCSDGQWVLQHLRTGRPLERSVEALYDALRDGKLQFEPPKLTGIAKHSTETKALPSLDLPPEKLEAAKLRLLYAKAAQGVPASRNRIEQVIDEVWQQMDPRPAWRPSWTSVYRWARALRQSEGSPLALVSDDASKGNREARYPPEVIDICERVIEDVYLTRERPGVQHTVDVAQGEVRRANALRPSAAQLPRPTRRVIQRLINQVSAFDRHVARYGYDSARKRFRAVLGYRLTAAPLECAEIDHTRMDVFVVDAETGAPLGRPWLTILIDCHTRCILGYCLSFEPPSRATVARCLRHAFMPKTNLRQKYPDLKNDWEPFGIVSKLVMDGGLEFHSADLENACFEFGIEQHFAPRKMAWFKGKVERFLGTHNREVAITMPGKTFGDIFERDDYDPKRHAVVTLSGLHYVIVRWIVDVYHQRRHRALDCSPAQMWRSSIRTEDIPLMDDPLRFDAILGGVAQRVLTHKGIEYAGLPYNSPEMAELRRQLGDRLDVEIRVDRSDLGSIIVLHPESKAPYRVPCLRQDYAAGLTEWQHRICKCHVRERKGADGDVDAWLDSLLEISDYVRSTLRLGRRTGASRGRSGRWLEGKNKAPAPPPVSCAQSNAEAENQHNAAATPALPSPAAGPSASIPLTSDLPIPRKRFTPVITERPLSPMTTLLPSENSHD